MILGILEIPLNYLLESTPDTLVIIRSFGISIGALAVLLIQFTSKLVYLFRNNSTISFGSSVNNHDSSQKEKKDLKLAASKGRFRIKPDILRYDGMALSTISYPERFFDEFGIFSCSTLKSSQIKQTSISKHSINKI